MVYESSDIISSRMWQIGSAIDLEFLKVRLRKINLKFRALIYDVFSVMD